MTQDELEPVDREQCQAEKPNGVNAFTLGGRFAMVRCTNKPVTIATEKNPGEDGLRGGMSLCSACWAKLIEQLGNDFCEFTPIE